MDNGRFCKGSGWEYVGWERPLPKTDRPVFLIYSCQPNDKISGVAFCVHWIYLLCDFNAKKYLGTFV